jgi:hypothetical protein
MFLKIQSLKKAAKLLAINLKGESEYGESECDETVTFAE